MSKQQIIRAWKDQAYRRGLSEAERALLPENPAGRVELDAITAAELAGINGGRGLSYSTNDPTACYVSTAIPPRARCPRDLRWRSDRAGRDAGPRVGPALPIERP